MMPRLFTKFATGSNAGTGLGLYISKSIIEAHGGKIWAENNPDRRGATFSFSLPLNNSKGVFDRYSSITINAMHYDLIIDHFGYQRFTLCQGNQTNRIRLLSVFFLFEILG